MVDKYELFAKLLTLSTKYSWKTVSMNRIGKEKMFWS